MTVSPASDHLTPSFVSRQDHMPLPPADHQLKYKMDRIEPPRPSTPEKLGRSSFSSVRENDDGLAQTFTLSKVSSYAPASSEEEAVEDLPLVDMGETQFLPPVTHPNSRLHGGWYPVNSFRGWKQINVRGKTASRSFGDLQALHMTWSTPPSPAKGKHKYATGLSPVERLPLELLGSIVELLVVEIPPNGVSRRNIDLMSLLLTSRTIHAATLNTLYKHITIPHSRIFRKFLSNTAEHPALGTIVRRLDFSHFNPSTLFQTASERAQTRNLTAETLARCLELTPHLQEFLAQEHIDDDLGAEVLEKLFFGLPRLRAVDFAGCASVSFKNAFSSIVHLDWPETLSITRLSLHKCLTLPSSVFETILPRLTNLTHLDVAATKITDKALQSIPNSALLTHLNISKCKLLSAKNVINFMATHPAVQTSLVYLSVATDARSHQLLDVQDVTELLSVLPPTLLSLSLKGSKMDQSHIQLLRPLTKHLEELSVGRNFDVNDASELLTLAKNEQDHTLRYLDLSDLFGSELDLADFFFPHCTLLKDSSTPLEVIEVSAESFKTMMKNPRPLERVGWSLREFGSRCWIVRLEEHRKGDNGGQRWWKMGADNWGMRKIPVARAEVGGMYGSYMFGRKL